VRIPMTLPKVGDFVLYLHYDEAKFANNEAAIGSCFVAPTNHTGFRFGSQAGSYLEVPGREGYAVYKITITAATNGEFGSDGTTPKTSDVGKLGITDSKGNAVEGGESSLASVTKGSELTWKFKGTNGMPYRIVSGGGETNILEVRVFYMSATDPLVFSAQGVTMQGVRVDPFDLSKADVSGSFDALPFFDETKFTCGFEYKLKTASTWSQVTCSTPGEKFSGTLSGLDPDKDYECRAVVTCGSTTLRSKSITFKTSFLEEAEDPADDVVKSYDYSVLKDMGHPRLLMRKGDFEKLAERVKDKASWPMLAKLNDLILSYASGEATSSSVITYTLDASNKRLLSVSRLVVKRLLFCSYAYRMTGNQIYLNKAIETLDIVCGQFPDWHPSHYLDTGEMALGVAIAYDWLYYDLDYSTRLMVRKALSKYGVYTALNDKSGKNATQTTTNNWNSVCTGGIVAAAIATYPQDKANAAQAIENALTSNAVAVEQMYSPDGNYGEGYGYWEYGTSYQVCLNELLIKAFGNDHGLSAINGFMKTGDFMLFMGSACGGNFSYADGGSAGEAMNIPMWWFAAKSGNAALLANEIRLLNNGKYSANRLLPVVPGMIMDFSFDPSNLPFPSSNMWTGEGLVPVAMVHTGWKFDANDKYFGFKGGAASGPHGHMDAGSFVYESQGVRWSDDLQRPDYAQAENLTAAAGGSYWTMSQKSLRWEFFRMNNLAHSTLTFENSDGSVSKTYATDHVVAGKATIVEKYTDASSLGVKMDLTPVFKGQAASVKRTVRLVGDDLVITDEVTALNGTDAKMQWRMLTPATVQKGTDGETLTRNGKALSLKAVPSSSSVAVSYTTWEPKRPSDWTKRTEALWNGDNTGYTIAGYTATVPKGSTVTFTTTLSKK
ncbi:MAG: heparinase II/III family protein, partial [Bacteroidales bacterium]|nr:heparinase II/III family protein [Bacteroidales bacterium]